MRLRHKKPINSYIGQTNQESNSAHDQDFYRNNRPSRKHKLLKTRPINDQTKKYGEILSDLISSINKNYRNFVHKNARPSTLPLTPTKANQRPLQIEQLHRFSPAQPNGKKQVVSKQQQNVRNQQYLTQKLPGRTKKIFKERHAQPDLSKKKEFKITSPAQKQNNDNILPKPTLIPQSIDLTQQQNKKNNPQQSQSQHKTNGNQQIPNYFINPFMAGMNNNMFNPFNLQMMMMMGLPNLEQMKNIGNANQFQIPMNLFNFSNIFGFPNMQGSQNSQNSQNGQKNQNNGIPFHKLPFFNQDTKNLPQFIEKIKNLHESQQIKTEKNQFSKKVQQPNNFQQKLPSQNQIYDNKNHGTLPNHRDIKIKKDQKVCSSLNNISDIRKIGANPQTNTPTMIPQKQFAPPKKNELPNFQKKQSNHISIAYKIHFQHLRDKGHLRADQETKLKNIDPTYPAKLVRESKYSDIIKGGEKNPYLPSN